MLAARDEALGGQGARRHGRSLDAGQDRGDVGHDEQVAR
jgi:hypothetical protein